MELRNVYLLVSLGSIWGASYLFIRVAAPAFGSWWLIAWRVFIAGSVLFIFSRITRQKLAFQNRWWHYVLLGIVNAALPFTLIANAVTSLNVSTSAIIGALMPANTAVVAAIWIGDKLTLRKITGLLLGIGGVVVLVGWNPVALSRSTVLAALQMVLATLFYGIGTVYTRVQFSKDTPLALAIGQQLGACVLQAPLAALKPLPAPSLTATLSMLALALVCTSIAYLIYFRLVASIGPARTSTVTFLVPFFSVVWGVLFLHEKLNSGIILGMALILCSIALVIFKSTGKHFEK